MLDVKVRRVIIGSWRVKDLENDPTHEAEAFLFVMNIVNDRLQQVFSDILCSFRVIQYTVCATERFKVCYR
jgi:hypothetical protein